MTSKSHQIINLFLAPTGAQGVQICLCVFGSSLFTCSDIVLLIFIYLLSLNFLSLLSELLAYLVVSRLRQFEPKILCLVNSRVLFRF